MKEVPNQLDGSPWKWILFALGIVVAIPASIVMTLLLIALLVG